MGWLVMWAAVFMLTATYAMDFRFERRDQQEVDRVGVTASQMFVWHKAAVQYCRPAVKDAVSPCPVGRVPDAGIMENRGRLAGAMSEGGKNASFSFDVFDGTSDTFAIGRYVTVADPADQVVATYYLPAARPNQTNGLLVSQMNQGRNWAPMMGFFDSGTCRVDVVRYMDEDNPAVQRATLPETICGLVPPQAPIIVTRF